MGEYAYYMDSEQKKGCCKKDDFLNGDVDEGKLFQDIYLEQLGEWDADDISVWILQNLVPEKINVFYSVPGGYADFYVLVKLH